MKPLHQDNIKQNYSCEIVKRCGKCFFMTEFIQSKNVSSEGNCVVHSMSFELFIDEISSRLFYSVCSITFIDEIHCQ